MSRSTDARADRLIYLPFCIPPHQLLRHPLHPLLPVAYWFAAAVPLAHLSQNARLLADLQGYVEHILATQEASGWLGPPNSYTDGNGEWARWPVLAGLLHWREATGDARLLPAVLAHLRESYRRLSTDGPLGGNWAGSRWEVGLSKQTLNRAPADAP